MVDRLDEEATSVVASIAAGPRLAVIGSTSFWGADSRELCEMCAGELALIESLVAITGGMDGVAITFGKSFATARTKASLCENLFHLLPCGLGPCDCGVTLGAGVDFHERREILGRVGHVYFGHRGRTGYRTRGNCRLNSQDSSDPTGANWRVRR